MKRAVVGLLPAGDTVRIIMPFDRYADPQVPYMYHCHIMEHEDAGMMGQFLVVEDPEQVASRPTNLQDKWGSCRISLLLRAQRRSKGTAWNR